MRKITIIYDGTIYTYRWLKAMMWAKCEFRKLGYKIEYANLIDYLPIPEQKAIKFEDARLKLSITGRFDIVFLAFHHASTLIGQNAEKRLNLVKKLKNRCKLLCWMDTADSTGNCLFDVLPYVDLYFKKQMLNDIEQYTKEFYCGRPYADYYHKKFGLTDEALDNVKYPAADIQYLNKLRVSWNVAFYDRIGSRWKFYLHPFSINNPNLQLEDNERTLDVHYGGSNPKMYGDVVGYQRKKILELINDLKDATHPDVYKKIPREEYLEELKHSKSIASPFGWGECCLRDFEAFYNRAVLLKPSMEHCVTYPDVYQEFKTYIPVKWDFSDFEEKVQLMDSDEFKKLAKYGQENYIEYRIGPNAKRYFAEHIIIEITK